MHNFAVQNTNLLATKTSDCITFYLFIFTTSAKLHDFHFLTLSQLSSHSKEAVTADFILKTLVGSINKYPTAYSRFMEQDY